MSPVQASVRAGTSFIACLRVSMTPVDENSYQTIPIWCLEHYMNDSPVMSV